MESKKHKPQTKSIHLKLVKTNAIFFFRFTEMFFFLVSISRFSSQLPSAVKLAGDYFTGINSTAFNFSPKFVFVIGNLIVLILFLKSRNVQTCSEYVNENVYLSYEDVNTSSSPNAVIASNKPRIIRSKSEDKVSEKSGGERTNRELRRSVTEMRRSGKKFGVERSCVEDELSCEDFRRTVEAFIARQQKILRDEELVSMVCVGSG